jgi:C1A family cysteine protease
MQSIYNWYYGKVNSPLCQDNATQVGDDTMPLKTRKYGWKPDIPDIRDMSHDIEFSPSVEHEIDMRGAMPPIYNQGPLGSCTANAIAGAIQYDEIKQSLQSDVPSRLFIYYNEREMEGSVQWDAGAQIRDGIKSINKVGYCDESLWPYDIDSFTVKPRVSCYEAASHHKAVVYKRVSHDLHQIKQILASGFPIVYGFTVYSSFETDDVELTGFVPMPEKDESVLGGHAILAVGYNDDIESVIFRNSWGTNWGDKGYGYMPYEYITNPNLARDFWTVERIS